MKFFSVCLVQSQPVLRTKEYFNLISNLQCASGESTLSCDDYCSLCITNCDSIIVVSVLINCLLFEHYIPDLANNVNVGTKVKLLF